LCQWYTYISRVPQQGDCAQIWATRYNTWLLIKLTPKGVVFSFLCAQIKHVHKANLSNGIIILVDFTVKRAWPASPLTDSLLLQFFS
jgi:predicted TIM-barrel enzyme